MTTNSGRLVAPGTAGRARPADPLRDVFVPAHGSVDLDALPHPAWGTTGSGAGGLGNRAWAHYVGERIAYQLDWFDVVHPDDRDRVIRAWEAARRDREMFRIECRLRHHSGDHRWFVMMAQPPDRAPDGTRRWIIVGTDIDERARAHDGLTASVDIGNTMLDASVDCIKILETDGTVVQMNKAGYAAFGLSTETDVFGMRWLDLLPEQVRARGQRALGSARAGRSARFPGMSQIPGQPPRYWDNLLTPIKAEDGTTSRILCVSRDVTAQREAEARLRTAGEVDDLTGLHNRRAFKAHLKRSLARARGNGESVGLLLIDLDHFKLINDTLGHSAGDHLLRVLSRRLRSSLPDGGYVARLGGDEFGVVIENISDDSELMQAAQCVSMQMTARITYAGKVINGGMSIGGAICPSDAVDVSGLMKAADTALNDLKEGGRGGIRMFSAQMAIGAEEASAQRVRARQLIRDNAILPHYQPKVRLQDGVIVGFEALLRWRDDDVLQLPGLVAEAFKDYELATKLGDMMHLKICRDISSWIDSGVDVVPVSLNAAPVEFLRDDYAERLLRRLEFFSIPTSLIEVEITEHILTDRGSVHVIRALNELKAAGVRVALDDFGTGHSSFAHLRDYPVDCVKIDAEFVRRLGEDPAVLAIVQAIAQLGPGLDIEVVAEGIETEIERQALQQVGCHIGQGFLFAAALDPKAVVTVLQSPCRLGSDRHHSSKPA